MKLLFHSPGHPKNTHAIQQMCASVGWDCEFTRSYERLRTVDYDIVILNGSFRPLPEEFPPHVKILYGPQHWVFPTGDIIGPLNPAYVGRAAYNHLSEWNKETHLEIAKSLRVPSACLPFGVDVTRFAPAPAPSSSSSTGDGRGARGNTKCLLYTKHRHPSLTTKVCDFLRERGITELCVYNYGSYKEADYLRDLQQARFMVVVDGHESQGFALQEAMACNVPLLVLDATSMFDEVDARGVSVFANMAPRYALRATSVPYWSDKCGVRITNGLDGLLDGAAFEEFVAGVDVGKYEPRKFVLETLSPEVCMRRLLRFYGFPE